MTELDRKSKEQLAVVLQVVKNNPVLLSWFRGLADLPDPAREREVRRLIAAMRANQEDERLVAALLLLVDATLFRVAEQAIADAS